MSAERRDHLRETTQGALRPLTIRQVLSVSQAHPTADFILDDIVVNKVTLVAHVVDIVLDGSGNTQKFFLEDGSAGRLVAQRWLDSAHKSLEEIPYVMLDVAYTFIRTSGRGLTYSNICRSNCYVRVVGVLHRFRDVNSLKAFSMRRVTDMHEPFHHLLEAMIADLWYKRGPPVSVNHIDAIMLSAQRSGLSSYRNVQIQIPRKNLPLHLHLLRRSRLPRHHPLTPSRPPTQSQPPTQSRPPTPPRTSAPSQIPTPSRPPASAHPPPPSHKEWNYAQPQEPNSANAHPDQADPDTDGDGLSTTDQSEDKDEFYSVPPSPSPSPGPSPSSEHASPQLSTQYHWRDPYSDLSTLHRSIMLQIHNNTMPSESSGVSLDLIVRGLAHTSVTSGEIGEAIEELLDAGMVYTCDSDGNHFRVAD
ncbi:hypothetical protein EVG20_g340 [Dentipellis fragilis]|uniref:Replication protein A C-terminal domain-containing protein n=1 Tax=Dentipellis fragilis TaxID=205917 RepID=A0A4Y9ZDK8_9AGAM|nr:hypothetical protein EVG20_g340 [Dentipellis fragilis]